MQFLPQFALLVGIVKSKSWLEFRYEPFVGVLLFPCLTTGCLFGIAHTLPLALCVLGVNKIVV